jgi:PAS domain S-box-containing protein
LKTLTFLDITHPDDRPATRALQQNAVKGKRESFEVEKRYIRKNGAIVWVHVSVGAIHDASGHVTHTIGLITDITERKRSEEALRESEAQFRALAESTTDWLWEIDEQGRYTYCSPKIRDLLGYEPDEALGKTPFDFMPEEEARRVAGVFGPIAAARLPFAGIENTNRHKNGRLVILECRGTPIIDDNGVFGGYRGFDQDITERKQAERALQDRERALARFKATLDQTHDCVFMFAPDTLRFIYCNRGAVEQVGYSEVELSAMTPLDIKPEFTERSFREILQPLQDGSKVSHVFETIHRHKDGHDVAVEVSVQLVREEGQEGRFVAVVRDITERKQAEQALRESEEKFRTIVEASPIGIFMIDPSGSVTYGNAADLRMTGLSWEDTLGTRWIKAIHPEDRVQVLADWQAAMQQGKSYVGTGRYLHEDGTIVWWDVQTVAVRVSGRLLGHVGMVVDITVRKQAEDALRASEERLRLSLEAASQGIYDLNVQTGEALVSSGYASMLGYDPATFHETTDAWIERLHPDDRERVADYYRAYVAGEIPEYRVEFRQRTYGGDWRWVLSLGRIVERDARGEPLRMLGTHTDITERKRVEESLRISEERFQIVARATNEAIWDWDLNTDEVEWNQGFQDLFGYKSEDIEPSAQSWTSRLHPDDRGRVIAEIHAAIGSGKQFWCDEYRFLRADGSHAHIFDRGYIIHDSAAKPIRMIGSMQDITERKQAEEALRASEERFELAVRGSNTAIWDWDLRTNKTYFSPLWKSMLGYGEHELKDEFFEWEERLHPDDRDRSSATVRAYLNGTNPQYELEHRLRHKDGSYRWILARGVSICDTEGKPYRMSGSHIDITELKETQETLAQRERQLQTVLDALPLGVWFTDQAGRLLLANPAARQIWSGIRQVGIETGANAAGWWEAMGPSRELHRWALSQALTKGIPSLHETLDLECLDGTKKTIRNSTVPVRDEAGLVVGALVLNEDVTSLRQAQEALRLTQFSVDHAVEAFFWIDHQGNILNVNESACRMLERSREELITMTVHDIDPNFPPELWPTHWAELKQKGSITFETKLWSQPGHVIATEVTVNYLHYDGHEYNCAIMRDIGERKRAEEALRRSEARLRTITDAVPGAVYQYELSADGTQRFLFLSQGIQGLFGVTSAEGENDFSSIWNRILPGEVEDFWASIRESSEILSPWKHEFRILHADGTTRWIRGNSIPESPRNDGSILWNGILVDITERKQAEETLRLAKFSMDRAADAVYWIDPQAKVLYVNEAGSFMLGYSKDELCAMTVHDLNPAFEADKWPEFWEETKRRGTMVIETVHRSKNGRLIPVEVSANYLSHEGKEYHCAFVRDITERQQAEEKLRESHAFIRQIIDTNPNLIFVKDREGRFTLANKAVADTYGTTVENLIGKTDADFNANQEEVVSFRQNDLEVMETLQELFLSEEMITDSMGRTRWLQTVKRPILDHEGRAIMVLGSSTDITERKRMEETLRQREHDLRAALEGRERISQDLHDGILQSLFAVGLALESVKLTMSARNLKTSRASLNQAINQLNDVMREIRNFIAGLGSDLLKGRDLPAALQHMLETLTENQATRVRLAVEDRAAKALSTEQSSHLLRVIQEAVGNCIKHGRAQEARVSLKMLKQGVRLSIRDDGRGFNLSAAKGAGHGLTNMAARAQKIGGRLTILSKVNEGTRVVLDLPNEAVLAFH